MPYGRITGWATNLPDRILTNDDLAQMVDKEILKLNNLNIVNLDHSQLEFLHLKGLLDKDLIKPLYLS